MKMTKANASLLRLTGFCEAYPKCFPAVKPFSGKATRVALWAVSLSIKKMQIN